MATNANIGSAFGWSQNPLYQGLASNRNALMQFGAGLASGNGWSEGIANGLGGLAQGAARDDAYALMEEEKAQQQEAINQTTEWLRQNGKDALYAAVTSGAMEPGQAWQIALQEDADAKAAASQGVKPIEINGQLVDPATGQVIGDYRDPNAGQPSAPSGYQYSAPGQLAPIPGGPQDPASMPRKAPTEAELRAAGLTTVVNGDAALLLGTPDKPGIYEQLANGGDQAWNAGGFGINPLAAFSSPEYRQAKDAVASIAQSYLYSTSGASAPEGEAERIANSVTPKPFDSPQQLADKKRRLEAMVDSIRQKQGNAAPLPAPGGNTAGGISWSIEP